MRGRRVAFAHIDVDLYSSTRTVLRALAPRLTAGSVLRFDEWVAPFAAAGTASEEDAFRAVAASAGIAWKCVSWCGQGVTVLVIEDPPPPAT